MPEVKRCTGCGELKTTDLFAKNSKGKYGVASKCKDCANKWVKRYREKFPEKNREGCRQYFLKNKEKIAEYRSTPKYLEEHRLREARRRARKLSLPNTLTADEVDDIKRFFEGKCPISGKDGSELDHFIPLITECGGTTKENIIPLSKSVNSSKGGRNPFTWAETTLNESDRQRFYAVVHYLSEINGLTYLEYEKYVNNCFKNL